MKLTGSIFDYIMMGLKVSGGDPDKNGDFPNDKSSNQKILLPGVHDPKGVKQDHLAFSPMMHSPTSFSQCSFQGDLDPGTLCYFLKMPGESGGILLGQANDLVNYDKGAQDGGQDLLNGSFFSELFSRKTGKLIPPDIKEVTEDGVKIRAIKEKGKEHSHDLLKGIQSHNANQPTTGYKLEQIKEVPTARQHFDAIPTENIMGQLPGDISSLGQMFQGLMGNLGSGGGGGGSGSGAGQTSPGGQTPMDRIKKQIKPELYDAMYSISVLTQGTDTPEATSFVTSGRVSLPTYLANAEELLSQVTTLEDLFITLHRLQHDESLFGLEELANTIMTIETAWGNANVEISFAGDIELLYANSNTQNTFVYNMTSPQSSPSSGHGGAGGGGGGSGGNMFGKSAALMQDLFKRLPPNNQKESKKMHEKLNQENEAQKLWKFAETTINGGNPLDPSHFIG